MDWIFMFKRKIESSVIRLVLLAFIAVIALWNCDQDPPTSLKSYDQNDPLAGEPLVVSILALDFNYNNNSFFATAEVLAKDSLASVQAFFSHNDSVYTTQNLEDNGQGPDIIANDHYFNTTWAPDSIDTTADRQWTLTILAVNVLGDSVSISEDLTLALPVPPVIEWVSVPDTLWQSATSWVWDTLRVKVSHPAGLDEIRDVKFQVKPPGANDYGAENTMYDDGGALTFIVNDTLSVNTFDRVAGDGIYSYPVGKSPGGSAGMTYIKFFARAWNGLVSDVVIDSMFVVAPQGLTDFHPKNDQQSFTPFN